MNIYELIHMVFDEADRLNWKPIPETNFEFFYAEDGLYVFRNKENNSYSFVKATSLIEARMQL